MEIARSKGPNDLLNWDDIKEDEVLLECGA